ncbi:histidine phosphatase family protein [Catenuloplanes indicus]|uniref:Broad specificity phosphatase PhoE n=1 Tax=Catenuloplanes indicus TaxID=137267 RepID=A0AAE3VY79_9ACTN|nr:histidine phosphatase family protein [Catenuloplanes indicus]MDQ0365482.1 broad specificity phosphatase PhoE [Catenuloplanes indicus]
MDELSWLAVVRHGESTGNVAAARAEQSGEEVIDIPERDADVPLSPTGREQAAAVNQWLTGLPADERPTVAVISPYLRARQTAEHALDAIDARTWVDERLRDRELGVLDLLTGKGVRARHPEEAERRARLGKFYYRPPGGESWADVTLRLRSLLGDLRRDHAGDRVILFAHEAIVYLLRYLIEEIAEPDLVKLARDGEVGNCSITSWVTGDDGRLALADFAVVHHLHREGATPTSEEGVDAEPV